MMNSPPIDDLLYSNLTHRPFPSDEGTEIFDYPLDLTPVAHLLGGKRPEIGRFCSGRWCEMNGDDEANTTWRSIIEGRHKKAMRVR